MTESLDQFAEKFLKPIADNDSKLRAREVRKLPTGKEAGIEWDGSHGELRTGPTVETPSDWSGLLEMWGLNPDEVEIVGPVRRSSWDSGDRVLNSYRASIQLIQKIDREYDFEDLLEEIRTHTATPRTVPTGEFAFVVAPADLQAGKGNPVKLVQRFMEATDATVARLHELRASGRSLGAVYLLWAGDCLAAETEIVTRQHGVVRIGDIAGERVDVKDANGGWVNVLIKSYGYKPLVEVVWESKRAQKVVRASRGHEWVLRDGRRVRTEDLKPGMSVSKGYRRHGKMAKPSIVGVQAGFIYGDGTATGNGTRAIFCGEKDKALLDSFYGVEVSESDGKNQRRTPARFPESWKSLPRLDEGSSYLYGWLSGYFAADGCVDSHGGARLSSADKGSLEFVRSVCAVLGIDSFPIREVSEKATGRYNDNKLYEIALSVRSLSDEFFIIPQHRTRAIEARQATVKTPTWVVRSVTDTGQCEETFCTEVPTTQSFVLADGLLTSNCIEHVTGSYASQTFEVQLGLTEQIRLVRRLMLHQVKLFAPLASEVVLVSVPGNHDIAVRAGGKMLTKSSDSFAIDCASQVAEILAENPATYGHVSVVVPRGEELTVSLDICGTGVGVAHGHQIARGDAMRWWAGQAHGCKDIGDTTLLFTGHLHHLKVLQEGVKTHIQLPSMDTAGSGYFADATGKDSPTGMVSLIVGNGAWSDLLIL